MGNVSSACESCFNDKASDKSDQRQGGQKGQNDKRKNNDVKYDKLDDSSEGKNLSDRAKNASNGKDKGQDGGSHKNSAKQTKAEEPGSDKNKKLTIKDFDLIRVLGRGSFGKVFLVQKKANKKYYALKTLKKEEILNRGHIDNAMTEKNVLQNALHPFVVRLRYSFQNQTTLYLVMDFCPGGELFMQLKKKGRFDEEFTRFYSSEVILALQYLHEKLDIIYRDLKPENILLDANGHIKLTDFGLSKATKRSFSFCGTPEYLAPEILLGQGHDQSVDWWSLGCLIYEMLAGYPPFSSKNKTQLYQDILKTKPVMPSHFSESAKDLLSRLLVRNPSKRLGFNGTEEIKKHPFFESVNWEELINLKKKPPIVPTLTKPDDLRNFDRIYLNEPVIETPSNNPKILNDPKNNFQDFTYVPKDNINASYIEDPKSILDSNK